MARSTQEVIAELNGFQPADFEEDTLGDGFDHLYEAGEAAKADAEGFIKYQSSQIT